MQSTLNVRAQYGACRQPNARINHQSHPQIAPSVVSESFRTVEKPSTLASIGRAVSIAALAASLALGGPAHARLEGVNRPELLPQGPVTPVIDVAGFLTDGEEARIRSRVESLQQDTGIKLRVLAQNYPDTPGLAIKEYWGVDADTVVFVADPNFGDVINLNVGDNVDLMVPRNFWTRLAGKFGTKKYWQSNGVDVAMVNTVAAIDSCLREPVGKLQCQNIRGELE